MTIFVPQLAFNLIYHGDNAGLYESVLAFVNEWNAGMEKVIVRSSGSTGPPKSIVLTRDQLIASAERTLEYFRLKAGDKAIMALSPAVIGGKMMLVRAIVGGLTLHLTEPAANPLKELSENDRIAFIPLVPMQLKTILEETPEAIGRVDRILLGGSPVSEDLEGPFARLRTEVHIGFGMTETVSHIAMRKAGDPVYQALPTVSFSEKSGALVISDEKLGLKDLVTNDAIKLIDSRRFEWLGRTDFVINTGGVKIHPEQLEHVLAGYIKRSFIVSSLPDPVFGEKCVLIVEPGDIYELSVLKEICAGSLGRYAVPKEIHYSPVLRTPSGKTDRIATRQMLLKGL
jgi:o-succinylbenzoate---CoA ligase